MKIINPNFSRGFMAILAVVLIGAAALVMSLNSSLLGLSTLEFATLAQAGDATRSLADACLEEALVKLRLDNNYAGTPTLSLAAGSCIIGVTNLSANERQVNVEATKGEFERLIQAKVLVAPRLVTVSEWLEL
ncbi:MAG: hypothetical protein AAB455_00885 [Patescibacteria group bacterium]